MARANPQKTSAAQRREQQRKQQQIAANQGRDRARTRNSSNNKRGRKGSSKVSGWAWIVVVVLVVAAIIGVFVYASRQSAGTADRTPADPAVVNAVTHVSPSVLQTVGAGSVQNPPAPLKNQPPLTGPNGKPEVFYFGAEYCPYCAAQRWAVVVALSRFGTFSNLSQTTSSAADVYPSTPTFSFYGSKYTSQYIDFVSVETTTNQPDGNNGYTPLQTPTAAQQQLVQTYDSAGSIPFVDIGNKYSQIGPGYVPDVLTGKSAQDIANSLSDPSSPTAKGILGTANYLTAAICATTNQQPASVCQSAPIPAIEQTLNKTAFNSGGIQIAYVGDTPAAVAKRRHLA